MTARHDGRKLVIDGASAAARAIGLRPGLPVGEAQARVPGLEIHPADPAREAAFLRRAASLCLRYAPLTAASPPDGVMIDATGCAHLFGGEQRLLRAIAGGFEAIGFDARAAIAGTPGAAHAVARFGTRADAAIAVVAPGGEAAALATLPVEALRLEPEICAALRRLGLDTVASLGAVPRGPLARRYGTTVMRRLDQALGRLDEPIGPAAPPRPVASRLGFVEPLLTADAFTIVIGRLLDEICGRLEAGSLGARRLELGFERVDGTEATIRVALARPVRDRAHLARLLADRLETVDPGHGVEAMRLAVRRAEPLAPVQADSERPGGPADLAPLVDTLLNRLGPGRVWRPEPVESDVPERAVAAAPPFAPRATGAATGAATAWPDTLPRPVRLLDPPQPVTVMALVPDHPPASFTWRRIRHRVRHADGPERIAGEWWRRAGEVSTLRDYFRVEDEDGQRFWLFRRGDGEDPATGDMRWFVHGVF